MKKQNSDFYDWLLLFGGMWMLSQLFSTPEQAGIGGVPNAVRKLKPCKTPEGIELFKNDMAKLRRAEFSKLISLIVAARVAKELKEPIFKPLTSSSFIDGEFRDIGTGYRIFVKKIGGGDFMMLSFYKKQTNRTPIYEIDKAEQRAKNCIV